MALLSLDRSHYTVPNAHQPVTRTPYPFQKDAFKALDDLKERNPSGFSSMLVLPTGAGKTYTAVHWILKNYVNQGIKVLWIAHRSELLRQAAEAFFEDTTIETLPDRTGFSSILVSSEYGRSSNINHSDVVIASRQSVCSGSNMDFYVKWAKGRGLKAERKLLIVFDEAHHAAAHSYRRIISTMKKYIPHLDILGLTATPFRTAKSEQGSLKNIFHTGSGIAYSIDMNTLIHDGILANPIPTEVYTSLDMTEVFSQEEIKRIARLDLTSLDEAALKNLSENAERNRLIVDTYLKNRAVYGRTIVFAVDVLNAAALNATFKKAGIKSNYVVSAVSRFSNTAEMNRQIIDDFRHGLYDVLINVNILTEGTDIPNVQSVFLARPTTSRILMTQMIGRGLRGEPAGGTKDTHLVYFVDDWRDMVSFVSPKELLEGADVQSDYHSSRKAMLQHFIKLEEVERCASCLYEKTAPAIATFKNIIPYGLIHCSYMAVSNDGEETEFSRDILVFDEGKDAMEQILLELPTLVEQLGPVAAADQAEQIGSDLFFQYCVPDDTAYIGITSDIITDILLTYLSQEQVPTIQPLDGRVSLSDLASEIYQHGASEKLFEQGLKLEWESNAGVRAWYDYELYWGLMHVYYNRLTAPKIDAAALHLPPKEDMDMWELKKYFPAYCAELKKALLAETKRDSDGYYYSAIQEQWENCPLPPYRSKRIQDFEIDHIIPISKGGKTIKENLQLILRWQNRKLGAKDNLPHKI